MKQFILILCILLFSKIVLSENIFETKQNIVKFKSDTIETTKDNKINDIKIKNFKSLLKKILTEKNYAELENKISLSLVDSFILNMKISNEKIINNNYYSEIKINFNKKLIVNYFILNKINYNIYLPDKFLIVIVDENPYEKNLLTKNNIYYKYLLDPKNKNVSNNFLIPNLDYNDRYIFNLNNFKNNYTNIIKLLKKYNAEFILLTHIKNNQNMFYIETYLLNEKQTYNLNLKNNVIQFNIKEHLIEIHNIAIDKWKQINQINVSSLNNLNCKIKINNIYELKFIRRFLLNNLIIKNLKLKYLNFNENIYSIYFYGNIDTFINSFNNSRLNISYNNNICKIKLI